MHTFFYFLHLSPFCVYLVCKRLYTASHLLLHFIVMVHSKNGFKKVTVFDLKTTQALTQASTSLV